MALPSFRCQLHPRSYAVVMWPQKKKKVPVIRKSRKKERKSLFNTLQTNLTAKKKKRQKSCYIKVSRKRFILSEKQN